MLLCPGLLYVSRAQKLHKLTQAMYKILSESDLAVRAQMGGPEDVRAAERTSITLSSSEGMKVHALPRAAKA